MSIIDSQAEILIVDDSVQYSQVLERILRQGLGYSNITTVKTAQDAEQMLHSKPDKFDLVFVDHNLGAGATGCDLLKGLSVSAPVKERVFFLITSEPSSDNMKRALEAGAAGLIAKPFDRELLRQQLLQVAKAQELTDAESF